jgi:hypothetical protein
MVKNVIIKFNVLLTHCIENFRLILGLHSFTAERKRELRLITVLIVLGTEQPVTQYYQALGTSR